MKGLDTNLLVRLIAQDDQEQAAVAERYVTAHCAPDRPCYVNRVVLCELVWVLERAYRQPSETVADVIERLLRTADMAVEDAAAAWSALHAYRTMGVDFADAFIARTNASAGCESTATFDRRAGHLPEFEVLS